MTQGKVPSEDLCWAVACMLAFREPLERICLYTNLSSKAIHKIENRMKMTGSPAPSKRQPKAVPVKKLTPDDLVVSSEVVQQVLPTNFGSQFLRHSTKRQLDIQLEALAKDLCQFCGVSVDESSVWRGLRKMGLTRKKVEICRS